MASVVYVAERGRPSFQTDRLSADVVCAGDSITGWNNFGVVRDWPYRTYPEVLQRLCEPLGLSIANVGIAGEISPSGLGQVQHRMRDYHNERLAGYCMENQVPLVDVASKLRDGHFGDELHPNVEGAQVFATAVYRSIAGFTPLSQ